VFAHVDQACGDGDQGEDFRPDQAVMDDHIGLLQGAQGPQRQVIGGTGAGADKGHRGKGWFVHRGIRVLSPQYRIFSLSSASGPCQ